MNTQTVCDQNNTFVGRQQLVMSTLTYTTTHRNQSLNFLTTNKKQMKNLVFMSPQTVSD